MVNGKMHIVDTYAWIEYFIGSEKGEKAAVIIDDPNEHLITVECCLAEIRHEVRKTVPGFGLIDSVILAVQEEKRCMVLTGDPHFEGVKDVVFLK
jgi:hypothetical protein